MPTVNVWCTQVPWEAGINGVMRQTLELVLTSGQLQQCQVPSILRCCFSSLHNLRSLGDCICISVAATVVPLKCPKHSL